MYILGLDTSGKYCSVVVLNNDNVVGEAIIKDGNNNHSVVIMPLVDKALKKANVELGDIDYFAYTEGPGSFTGLRVGLSTIKAFAQVFNKEAVGASSLETLAYNIVNNKNIVDNNLDNIIVPIIDARSERVFGGFYSYNKSENALDNIKSDYATTIRELLEDLLEYININKLDNLNLIFLGDGFVIYNGIVQEFINNNLRDLNINFVREIDKELNYCRAVSAGLIAHRNILNKKKVKNIKELNINYLKKTQAEQELLSKNKK